MLNLLTMLFVTSASAQSWDSVAVFHRSEKVIVQINERAESGRLNQLFDSLGADQEFRLTTSDESVVLDCGRNERAASCVFRFLPSSSVKIDSREVRVAVELKDLRVKKSSDVDISFANSNGDTCRIEIKETRIHLRASKRVAPYHF